MAQLLYFSLVMVTLNMKGNKRHTLYFKLKICVEKENCAVHVEKLVIDQTCQKGFAKYLIVNFLLTDAPRSGTTVEVKVLFGNHQLHTMRKITMLDYVNIFNMYLPYTE